MIDAPQAPRGSARSRVVRDTVAVTLAGLLASAAWYQVVIVPRMGSSQGALSLWWWILESVPTVAALGVVAWRTGGWRELGLRIVVAALTTYLYGLAVEAIRSPGTLTSWSDMVPLLYWLVGPVFDLVRVGATLVVFYLIALAVRPRRPE